MADFVSAFLDYTKDYETPTSFWKWSAYVCISSVLRDNVHFIQKSKKICTNLYVLLLADSGIQRKSGPIIEVFDLLSKVKNTKLIRGRSSIQAVMDDLAQAYTEKETGKVVRGGSCLLCADELASFFVDDPAVIKLLTDIYDYRDVWNSRLKQAQFRVQNLCVNFLAASNETFLKAVYTEEAAYGGLLGRTLLIMPDEYRPGNSLWTTQESHAADLKTLASLSEKLKEFSNLKGEIHFEIAAQREYDSWYLPLRESLRDKRDKTGILHRIHTTVLKIASILAINETGGELRVLKRHIEEAISSCMSLIPNYGAYAMSTGKSSIAQAGSLLLNMLWKRKGRATRREVLTVHWADFDAKILDELINTFTSAGFLSREIDLKTNDEVYIMTQKAREVFEKEEQNG